MRSVDVHLKITLRRQATKINLPQLLEKTQNPLVTVIVYPFAARKRNEFMQPNDSTAFDLLVKPIRRLIEQRGFSTPTEPQEKTIPKILEGKNVVLISPTATGKTEAAFLPILSMLLTTAERPPGIKVLYITPLRALNRDMLERL